MEDSLLNSAPTGVAAIVAASTDAPSLAPTHAPTTVIGSSISGLMQSLSVAEYLGACWLRLQEVDTAAAGINPSDIAATLE